MPKYTYDHIHLRTKQTRAMAEYFEKMFDAKIVESIQSDGVPRIDLDIDGLMVFIAEVPADATIPASPPDPHTDVDHFGFRVDNLAEAVKELKEKGAEFASEPRDLRPGLKIAFVRAPGDVRIELLERS